MRRACSWCWWVRGSFAVVLVAAAVGAVFSLVLLVPSIASMLTIINGVVAWSRLEGRSVGVTAGSSA